MKSFLIIGLGRFGTHLCKDLSKLDNEIMVVDENEAVMEDVLSFVTSAKLATAPMKSTCHFRCWQF